VGANLLSIALWGSSLIILEKNTHRILWFLGVLSEVLVNIIVRGDKTLSWAASHLAERLGLLTLIVLGKFKFVYFYTLYAINNHVFVR
jgi:low temperature requirement protein LtrA